MKRYFLYFLIMASLSSLLIVFPSFVSAQCTDSDLDGYYYEEGCGTARDCNDADPNAYPGAIETCNGYDDDCDGSIDNGCDISCSSPEKYGIEKQVSSYVVSHNAERPCMVWSGSLYGVTWYDNRTGNGDIYFARLDKYGNKLSSDSGISSTSGVSSDPVMIWNGMYFSIAWSDEQPGNSEIYFARLNASGSKIGGNIRVTSTSTASANPGLVWNGASYGMCWEEYLDTTNAEIYFALLDKNGSKIGADKRISYNNSFSLNPSLTWSGIEFGIAWNDIRDGNDEIYFVRLDASGNKIGSDIRITNDSSISQNPFPIWNGSEYGIVWDDQRDKPRDNSEIYLARLDASGSKIGSDIRLTNDSSHSLNPSIAWSGSDYMLSWNDGRDGNNEIYFARLDASGNKISSDMRITNDSAASQYPFIIWDGLEFAISWQDDRTVDKEIYFSSIRCCDNDVDSDTHYACEDCDDADAVMYPGASQICDDGKNNDCNHAQWPALQDTNEYDDDSDYFTECQADCDDTDGSIYPGAQELCGDGKDGDCDGSIDESVDNDGDGHYAQDSCLSPHDDCNDADSFINSGINEICNGFDDDCDGYKDEDCNKNCYQAGRVGNEKRIANSTEIVTKASLAWTGNEYGVSWSDERDGNGEIYFARLDSSGNRLSADVRITNDDSWSGSPSLAWTGSEYGISWTDGRDGNGEIYFAVLDSVGNKTSSDTRITFNEYGSSYSCLVWNGSGYGLTYSNYWLNAYDNEDIRFMRLDPEGNKIFLEKILSGMSNWNTFGHVSSLVWTGSEYGVAFEDGRYPEDEWEMFSEILFRRLDYWGNGLPSDGRITYHHGAYNPTLVWNGSEYALSFNSPFHGSYQDIYLVRIDSSGNQIGSEIIITDDSHTSRYPSLAWNGEEYGLSWQEYFSSSNDDEIYFIRIDEEGNKISPDIPISDDPASSDLPFLVWNGNDYGVAWKDYRDGHSEVYFAQIYCCDEGIDGDLDTYSECVDCNDDDNTIHLGASEVCDGKDNNCDGTVDEGFSIPGYTGGLIFIGDKQTMNWDIEAVADRYDVVKGDLMALWSSFGDFTSSLSECLEDDSADTQSVDTAEPSQGEGFYYLVRAQASCKNGTYDTGQAGQTESRDQEMNESSNKCP